MKEHAWNTGVRTCLRFIGAVTEPLSGAELYSLVPRPLPFLIECARRGGGPGFSRIRAGMRARIPLLLSVMANEPQARDE